MEKEFFFIFFVFLLAFYTTLNFKVINMYNLFILKPGKAFRTFSSDKTVLVPVLGRGVWPEQKLAFFFDFSNQKQLFFLPKAV